MLEHGQSVTRVPGGVRVASRAYLDMLSILSILVMPSQCRICAPRAVRSVITRQQRKRGRSGGVRCSHLASAPGNACPAVRARQLKDLPTNGVADTNLHSSNVFRPFEVFARPCRQLARFTPYHHLPHGTRTIGATLACRPQISLPVYHQVFHSFVETYVHCKQGTL